MKRLSSREIWDLAYRTLSAAGFTDDVSHCVADVTVEAEIHGNSAVGLSHLFNYVEAARDGLINRTPHVQHTETTTSMMVADADDGPMQYAFSQSIEAFIAATKSHGIAMLMVTNAFPAGELGYYTRRLAKDGIASISTVNSPAVMSFGGSTQPLLGTNPLSYGVPLADERAVIVDQASSSTALVNVQHAAQSGTTLPEGWAIDSQGQMTTDPTEALAGALLPFGDYKGGNIAMLVELLAMMGGAQTSHQAAGLDGSNGPARVGGTFIGIDVQKLPDYTDRVATLFRDFADAGSDIRGVRTTSNDVEYIEVADQTVEEITRFIETRAASS